MNIGADRLEMTKIRPVHRCSSVSRNAGLKLRLIPATVILLLALWTPHPAAALLCVADCDHSGHVSIDETVMATRIALGTTDTDSCDGADVNHDGVVDVHELVSAVVSIVDGCYSEPSESMPVVSLAIARALAHVHNLQRAVVGAFAGSAGSGLCDLGGGVDTTCEDQGTGYVRVEVDAQSCRIGSLEGPVRYDGPTVLVGLGVCTGAENILIPANLSFDFDVTGVYEFPDGSPNLELRWLGSMFAERSDIVQERCRLRGVDAILGGEVSFRPPDGAEVSIATDETSVISRFADFVEEGPGIQCEPRMVVNTLDGPAQIGAVFGEEVQAAGVTFRSMTTTFHRDTRLAEIEGEVRGADFGGLARFATPEPLHLPLGSSCFNAGVLEISLPTGTTVLRAGPGGAVEVDTNGDGTPEETITTCYVPECGDGIIEAREQCDAENADACLTGVCDPDCACASCLPRDPSFGTAGIVLTDAGGKEDFPTGLVVQPDGKIVVAGAGTTNPNRRFTLIRYSSDGSLDDSFDGDGFRSDDLEPDFNNEAFDLLLQPDGKLVAVGRSAQQRIIVARYLSDGSLDGSFGGGAGFVNFSVGGGASAHAGALYDDNGTLKIVVAGQESFVNQFVLRLEPDGSFDSDEFGTGGVVITDVDGTDNEARGVAVQPDGKIVTVGFAGDEAIVFRYDADGELDESFGSDGLGYTKLGMLSEFANLATQTDGKIIAVGSTGSANAAPAERDFLLARFDTTGQLDLPFGIVTTDVGGPGSVDQATGIVVRNDGSLVVSGFSGTSIAVIPYDPEGSIPCANALYTTEVPGQISLGTNIALQSDGKVVVAGTLNPGRSDYIVVRYLGPS